MTAITSSQADAGDPLVNPFFKTPRKPLAAGSPTRSRARLLWRGSLLLPDGTPLPGLCFVSSIAPLFSSSTPGQDGAADPADEDAEAELGLGLALETIRHAPIRIIKVIEGLEGEAAALHFNRKPGAAPASIEWRSSGNIRMYIDPREQATVAYFERHFLYPLVTASTSSPSRSQTTFLLSTSVSPLGSSQSYSADPFRSTSIDSAPSAGGQELALWATWDPLAQGKEPTARLVVGRRIVKRGRASSGAYSRPDDPAPRMRPLAPSSQANQLSAALFDPQRRSAGPRMSSSAFSLSVPGKPPSRSTLSKSRSTPNLIGLTPVKEETRGAGSRAEPDAGPNRKRKSAGNHTPGRRGEKRPVKLDAQQGHRPRIDSLSGSPTRVKRERSASVMSALSLPPSPKRGTSECPSLPTTSSSRLESDNRAAIKKLVHYQLLGRGIAKGSADYTACYSTACSGTFIAFRNSITSSPIVSSQAARIVAAHLALYLDPLPESTT